MSHSISNFPTPETPRVPGTAGAHEDLDVPTLNRNARSVLTARHDVQTLVATLLA